MEGLLLALHLLWLPTAIALGFLIVRRKPKGGRKIALGCLWSFLLYAGGFIGLIILGLATCKMHFQ